MIIRLDVKKELGPLFEEPGEVLRRAIRKAVKAAAERYTEMIHDYIDAGKAFKPRTGILQQSIGWRAEGDDKAVVFANAEYAPYVEYGTRPHPIRAKKRRALKIPLEGGEVLFRKAVRHPGSRPYPFFFAEQARREREANEAAREAILEYIRGLHR